MGSNAPHTGGYSNAPHTGGYSNAPHTGGYSNAPHGQFQSADADEPETSDRYAEVGQAIAEADGSNS